MGKPKTPEESFNRDGQMLEINWDEEFAKLEKLSAEEIEQLNADFDPENSLLPIHDRTGYSCTKKAGRMYEREVLLDHLEEFAKSSKVGDDYVPFVRKEKPPSKWDPKEEKKETPQGELIIEAGNEKSDLTKLSKEESEALTKASAQELVEAAAQMGMNSFLTQEQVHSVKLGEKPEIVHVTKATKMRKPAKPTEDVDCYLDLERLEAEMRKNDPSVIAIAVNNLCFLDVNVHERIAACLKENTTLKFLSLANSNINDYSLRFYSDALLKNTTLESLNLESNYITPIGIRPLMNSISANQTLREILLENQRSKLGQKCELEISNNLKGNLKILNFGLSFESPGPRGTVSNILLRNNDRLREARKKGDTTYKLPEARKAAIAYLNTVGIPPWIKQKPKAELPNKMMLQAGIKNLKRVPSGQRSPRVASPERKRSGEELDDDEESSRRSRMVNGIDENEASSNRRRERREKEPSPSGPVKDPFDDDDDLVRKKRTPEEKRRRSINSPEGPGMGIMGRKKKEKSPVFDDDDNIKDFLSEFEVKKKESQKEGSIENDQSEEDAESSQKSRRERRKRGEDNEEGGDEVDSGTAERRRGKPKDPFEDDDNRRSSVDKQAKLPVINVPEPTGMQPMSRRRREKSPIDDGDDVNSFIKDIADDNKEKEDESAKERRERRARGEEDEKEGTGSSPASRGPGKDPWEDDKTKKSLGEGREKGEKSALEPAALEPARRRRRGNAGDEEEGIDSLLKGVPQAAATESKDGTPERQGTGKDPFEDDEKSGRKTSDTKRPIIPSVQQAAAPMEPARRRRRGTTPTDDGDDINSFLGDIKTSKSSQEEAVSEKKRYVKDPFDDDAQTRKKEDKKSFVPAVQETGAGLEPARRQRRERTPINDDDVLPSRGSLRSRLPRY